MRQERLLSGAHLMFSACLPVLLPACAQLLPPPSQSAAAGLDLRHRGLRHLPHLHLCGHPDAQAQGAARPGRPGAEVRARVWSCTMWCHSRRGRYGSLAPAARAASLIPGRAAVPNVPAVSHASRPWRPIPRLAAPPLCLPPPARMSATRSPAAASSLMRRQQLSRCAACAYFCLAGCMACQRTAFSPA